MQFADGAGDGGQTPVSGPGRLRRRRALFAVAAGLAVLAAGALLTITGWPTLPGRTQLNEAQAVSAPSPSSSSTPDAVAAPPPPVAGEQSLASARSDAPFTPTEIVLPSLHVTATVRPVGVRDNGDLDVPTDPDVVGWWDGSANAAAGSGQTVIAGHVATRAGGYGAFYRLTGIAVGSRVLVAGKLGEHQTYTIAEVAVYPKNALPLDLMFGQDTNHRLVLISCAGGFDRRTGHYKNNVVAYATPDA